MANENKYYQKPFGEDGDRKIVPDSSVDGSVSYSEGYGADYQRAKNDPLRKKIPREAHNGLLHGITENLKQWQEFNFPTWIEDDGNGNNYKYEKNILVNHNGKTWISLEDNNEDEPTILGEKWRVKDFIGSDDPDLDDSEIAASTVATRELSERISNLQGGGVSKYIELDDVKGVIPNSLPVLDESEEMIHLPLVTVGADNDADVSSNADVFYIVNSSGFLTLSNSQLSSDYAFVAPGSIQVNTSTTKLEVFVSVDFQRNNINATFPLAPCAVEVYIDGASSGHIVNIPASDSAEVESMSLDFGEISVVAGAKLSLFVTVGDSPNPSAGLTILENTRLYVVNNEIAPNIKIPGSLIEPDYYATKEDVDLASLGVR